MSTNKTLKEKILSFIPEEKRLEFSKIFTFETPLITPPNNDPNSAPATQAPAKILTKDGTEIKYDTPTAAVGTSVTVVTPDGELPAPDGEIVLADGTNLTVVGGKITEIETAKAESTEPPDPNAAAMAEMNEKYSGLEGQLAKANKIIEALTTRFEAQEKATKEVQSALEKFSKGWNEFLDMPTDKPIDEPGSVVLNKKAKASSYLKNNN